MTRCVMSVPFWTIYQQLFRKSLLQVIGVISYTFKRIDDSFEPQAVC